MIGKATGSAPSLVIPIYSPPEKLDLEGVLWIARRHSFLGDNGHIDVYIRRMFVTEDDRLIRPSWARFIMGMINSNKMGRIVSGGMVIDDRHAADARDFIKNRILEAFQSLRKLSEDEYWAIIRGNDDIIKKSAADNDEFLRCVWDKLRVRARSRKLTIPEYLAEAQKKIGQADVLYYNDELTQEQAAGVVSDATGVPVLTLYWLGEEPFVRRVCNWKKLELRPYTALAADRVKRPSDEATFRPLVLACAAGKILAEVRAFPPAQMPAMLMLDDIQERREQLVEILENAGDFESRRLAIELRNAHGDPMLNRGLTFYLNASSPLIRRLVDAPAETQRTVCLALFNIAYMSLVPQLKDAEVREMYGSLCSVLTALVDKSLPPPEPLECRPTRLFMITPYAKDYENVEQAVRDVFEGAVLLRGGPRPRLHARVLTVPGSDRSYGLGRRIRGRDQRSEPERVIGTRGGPPEEGTRPPGLRPPGGEGQGAPD